MNESRTHNPGAERLRRWVVAALVIAAVAYGAHSIYYNVQSRGSRVYAPSWNDVQRIVDANDRLDGYRNGGDCLKLFATADEATVTKCLEDPDVRAVVCFRVAIDFFRTLTREQIAALNGRLQFSKLDSRQQKLLCLMPGYRRNAAISPQSSYITMRIQRVGRQDPYANFDWRVRMGNGREVCYAISSYWLANAAENLRAGQAMAPAK